MLICSYCAGEDRLVSEPMQLRTVLEVQLSGLWVGHYSAHGPEVIAFVQRGATLFGFKITGDPNVPAGKETFRMLFMSDFSRAHGPIQVCPLCGGVLCVSSLKGGC